MTAAITDAELRECVKKMRPAAEFHGSMHSDWDVIFDCEGHLNNLPTILSREQLGQLLRRKFPEMNLPT